ncbi:hypothetical protein ACFQKF_01455 [Halalkalicoccus sp. GCM10025322]|uniref:hypothetical protein n=1 Tax=Halalkalicoccus TaxID=332246 RepID=UPI002F966F9A
MALSDDDSNELDETKENAKESAESAFDPVSEPVVLAAAASVAFSWYLFYMKGDKVHGLFVGLWAPTLLGAANYFKNLRVTEKLDAGLSFQ